jgi:hypothetical protein
VSSRCIEHLCAGEDAIFQSAIEILGVYDVYPPPAKKVEKLLLDVYDLKARGMAGRELDQNVHVAVGSEVVPEH